MLHDGPALMTSRSIIGCDDTDIIIGCLPFAEPTDLKFSDLIANVIAMQAF